MTPTEILTIIAAAIVIIGVAWYLRSRSAETAARRADPDLPHEREQAHFAAEEAQTEAMVRRYCPSCQTDREFRNRVCMECGYRLP